jgi:hypothetical protein
LLAIPVIALEGRFLYNTPMDKQAEKPEDLVMDAEAEKRFLDLARKALTTPVTEEQKQYEREYMRKRFTTKGTPRVKPKVEP